MLKPSAEEILYTLTKGNVQMLDTNAMRIFVTHTFRVSSFRLPQVTS